MAKCVGELHASLAFHRSFRAARIRPSTSGTEAPQPSLNGLGYPNTLFDAIEVLPDNDGDGLSNKEEVPAPIGFGTSPDNRDSDGDGLPDGWEISNGTSATTLDAAADPDHDLASNWQEYWAATSPTNALSYPGHPRTDVLSQDALAVLAYLAKLPGAASNSVIVGQHVTDIEEDWSNNVATLPGSTGKWPGIVSFATEGGPDAVLQMDLVLPRALEVWTNGGIPLIKWQPANPWVGAAKPLSAMLETVDSSEGRRRVAEHLQTLPYPHYEAADTPGLLVRITADGRRTLGRFVNRRFQLVKPTRK